MQPSKITFSAFMKNCRKETSISELGKLVSGLGFNGIELAVRPGYQVEPEAAEKGIPNAVKQLKEYGLEVVSLAATPTEAVLAGCQAAGIPIIRVLKGIDLKVGYDASIEQLKKEMEELIPLCEKYKVAIGLQNSCGAMISNSMEIRNFIQSFNTDAIGAVWDSAHSALCGEEPEQGLSIIWQHLKMINLKNAYYRRTNGFESAPIWEKYFTTGDNGLSDWSRIAAYLNERSFSGSICFAHEYTDQEQLLKHLKYDLDYARKLFIS
ncbi:TIM barrel protein [Paenibacillus sp. LHD-38]|uniref:sugar phosphate isomerase/epimerase family protein n=1 Tax=Paenibacillus sp. LHD-38 TaxID=3072143 RepID=UPI00280E1515|nr:TIM barrel protein [Paenibacillus sp. LHD-38]MDQ8736193.1 TIM barrel protein [Paenibacillus sp. LHD-38]